MIGAEHALRKAKRDKQLRLKKGETNCDKGKERRTNGTEQRRACTTTDEKEQTNYDRKGQTNYDVKEKGSN
ncbi:hypothetical protein Y032_0004g1775 [Ancylostoma ceylanicum]|uniref:Uncharacterized protein n=1 Tax=Ancylostoma ceylanicum TaxID=53326 RepID=A0A016VT70_9BILA|nr:hypothetical protein Y032_0004g1775 [Ancylostoma ceylanicum]